MTPKIEQAIILVAGMGARLKPLTEKAPKPLTEVNGTSILSNALKNLYAVGVREVTLVTGYMRGTLMQAAEAANPGLKLKEVYSPDFAETNNMYSLWQAREQLSHDCFLLEGDVFFSSSILPLFYDNSPDDDKSYWFVDRFSAESNGCMLRTENNGQVGYLEIIRDTPPQGLENCFKSIGILAVRKQLGVKLVRWLEEDISRGKTGVYYDLVLQPRLQEAGLHVLNVQGHKWVEIDDVDDLVMAEEKFSGLQS